MRLDPGRLIGMRFNEWTVTGNIFRQGRVDYAPCRCSCGAEKSCGLDQVRQGRSKSCGCLARRRTEAMIGQRYGMGWATARQQRNNSRRVVLVDAGLGPEPVSYAAERLGVNYNTAYWRAKHGLPIVRPVQP